MSAIHDRRVAQFRSARIYLVTSQALSRGRSTLDIVQAALAGGIQLIQLREKEMPLRELMQLAVRVRELTAQSGALLMINDRVDVALAVGADGVHLGQQDFPVAEARRIAPDLLIGASTHCVADVHAAQRAGASAINIGPIYETQTKAWDDRYLGLEVLSEMASAAEVPFSVMGGIKRHHLPALRAAGANLIAVVTAITAADDPAQAVQELLADLT